MSNISIINKIKVGCFHPGNDKIYSIASPIVNLFQKNINIYTPGLFLT